MKSLNAAMAALRLSLPVAVLGISPSLLFADALVNVGHERQLFVDDYVIGSLDNTFIKGHEAVPQGSVLDFEKPWEGRYSLYGTILKDGDRYLLYYRGLSGRGYHLQEEQGYSVAISEDGINFERPTLNLVEWDGSTENNLFLNYPPEYRHSFSPFIDKNPNAPPEERFKASGLRRILPEDRFWEVVGFVSADGIHWELVQEEPIFTDGALDSMNVIFWSEVEEQYVIYYRTKSRVHTGERLISRAVSDDFINWTIEGEMQYFRFDEPVVREEMYLSQTHPYYRAPQIYIATAARFMQGRRALTERERLAMGPQAPDRALESEESVTRPATYRGYPYGTNAADTVLMTTRPGRLYYDRTFMGPLVRPGTGFENWVTRSNYPNYHVVETGPDEMSIYVTREYTLESAYLERLSLRIDGFASIHAEHSGGEMITKPLIFKPLQGGDEEARLPDRYQSWIRDDYNPIAGEASLNMVAPMELPLPIGDSGQFALSVSLAEVPLLPGVILSDGTHSIAIGYNRTLPAHRLEHHRDGEVARRTTVSLDGPDGEPKSRFEIVQLGITRDGDTLRVYLNGEQGMEIDLEGSTGEWTLGSMSGGYVGLVDHLAWVPGLSDTDTLESLSTFAREGGSTTLSGAVRFDMEAIEDDHLVAANDPALRLALPVARLGLEINYSTSAAGSIRVELQDLNGDPIPGFTAGDSVEIIGDEISRYVLWEGGACVSELATKPVRIRFIMADADLYSFRFGY